MNDSTPEQTAKQIDNSPKPDRPWLWKPGQSGNPAGRPKKEKCLTDAIRRKLGEICEIDPNPKDGKKRTWLEVVVESLLLQTIRGGRGAPTSEIFDRLEGKVAQEISGPGGGPLDVRHISLVIDGRHVSELSDDELSNAIRAERAKQLTNPGDGEGDPAGQNQP